MALTATQLSDLQKDLGIGADGTVFTDAELNRLYERAGNDYNKTVVLGLRQLLIKLAGEADLWAGQTKEWRSQRFAQVRSLLDYYENVVVRGAAQIKIIGSRAVPELDKDEPLSG